MMNGKIPLSLIPRLKTIVSDHWIAGGLAVIPDR
jgi:hypothetical protein